MLPPDACLILLSSVLALVAYLFWVTGVLPRLRTVLAALALVALVATVIVHDVETGNVAAKDANTLTPPGEDHEGANSS
jgi:hypothetical protein